MEHISASRLLNSSNVSGIYFFTILSEESGSLSTDVVDLANILIVLGLDLTELVLKGTAHLLQIALWNTMLHLT